MNIHSVSDDDIDALRELAGRLRNEAECQSVGYGNFPGGDPRDFSPDPECATDAEIERHRKDCEAWERGEQIHREISVSLAAGEPLPTNFTSALMGPGGGHAHLENYGLGTYAVRDTELMKLAQDLDDFIDRLRQL